MFDDLHSHIQGTFAALSGYDGYEQQLSLWCYRQRVAESVRKAQWRFTHPGHEQPQAKTRWLRTKASSTCRRYAAPPAAQTRLVRGRRVRVVLCAEHLRAERVRAAARYEKQRRAG